MDSILIAFFLYTLAHLVRAFKYWLLANNQTFSFRKIFILFQSTSVFGFFIPLWLTELIRLVILSRSRFGYGNVVAYVLNRLIDMIVVVSYLIFSGYIIYGNAGLSKYSPFDYSALGFILFFLCSLLLIVPHMLKGLKRTLLVRWHTNIGVFLYKILIKFESDFETVFSQKPVQLIFVPLVLSSLAWIIDVSAVRFLIKDSGASHIAYHWLTHSIGKLSFFDTNRLIEPTIPNLELTIMYLNMPQLLLSLLILGLVTFKFLKKNMKLGAQFK